MKTMNNSFQQGSFASGNQNFIKYYATEARVILIASMQTKKAGTVFYADLTLPYSYPPTKVEFGDQKNSGKGYTWGLRMHILTFRKRKPKGILKPILFNSLPFLKRENLSRGRTGGMINLKKT